MGGDQTPKQPSASSSLLPPIDSTERPGFHPPGLAWRPSLCSAQHDGFPTGTHPVFLSSLTTWVETDAGGLVSWTVTTLYSHRETSAVVSRESLHPSLPLLTPPCEPGPSPPHPAISIIVLHTANTCWWVGVNHLLGHRERERALAVVTIWWEVETFVLKSPGYQQATRASEDTPKLRGFMFKF